MFVESFHRLLKVVYLDNKPNRRVDFLLYTLLRLARNLVYSQLQRIEKGKSTHRKCDILKRHKSAEEFLSKNSCTLEEIAENTWTCGSFVSGNTDVYTIQKLKNECTCLLRCKV
jgi:hypothetical protein